MVFDAGGSSQHGFAGHQLCVWAEEAEDAYFLWYLDRPLGLFALTAWYGRDRPVDGMADELDRTRQSEVLAPASRYIGHWVHFPEPHQVRALRLRPETGADPAVISGRWRPGLEHVLDRFRDTRIEAQYAVSGEWTLVTTLPWQLQPTWNWIELSLEGVRAIRIRLPEGPGAEASVEWIARADLRDVKDVKDRTDRTDAEESPQDG